MRMKKPFLFLSVIIAMMSLSSTLTACKETSKAITTTAAGEFSIYRVQNKDPASPYAFLKVPLSSLELQDSPWITMADIDYYDASSHYIYLNKPIPAHTDTKTLAAPFVVVASGERCYLGFFLSLASSYLPPAPVIQFPSLSLDDVVIMNMYLMDGASDVRDDARVVAAFAKAGKLSAGIGIMLTGIEVVKRAEVSTIRYSFTVTNGSDSPLYAPDPDKMGSDLFHYFTNGPYLRNAAGAYSMAWASQKPSFTMTPPETWNLDWYTRLAPCQSISRTVLLSGYTGITSGSFQCYFTYSGPSMVPRADRTRGDGTVWVGEVRSSTAEINITA